MLKECATWKNEIRELWRKVGESSGMRKGEKNALYRGRKGFFLGWAKNGARIIKRPGNTPTRELMSDKRFTEAVSGFLRNTKVGKIKEGVVLFQDRLRGRFVFSASVFPKYWLTLSFLFLFPFLIFFVLSVFSSLCLRLSLVRP